MEKPLSLTDEFFGLLQEETALVAELLCLAEEQKQTLTGFDVQSLQVITQKQTQCSEQLRGVERQRVALLSQLLGCSYAQASLLCLSDLIQMVNEEQAAPLLRYQTELKALTSRLGYFNNLNRILTERSKKFLQETVRILTKDGTPLYNVKI